MQGKKDYQEKLFIRFQLSDYVPEDNFYRQLKSILDFNFYIAVPRSITVRKDRKV